MIHPFPVVYPKYYYLWYSTFVTNFIYLQDWIVQSFDIKLIFLSKIESNTLLVKCVIANVRNAPFHFWVRRNTQICAGIPAMCCPYQQNEIVTFFHLSVLFLLFSTHFTPLFQSQSHTFGLNRNTYDLNGSKIIDKQPLSGSAKKYLATTVSHVDVFSP